MDTASTNRLQSYNNADDGLNTPDKPSQHPHVEQGCIMACEMSPSSHYGGMLNSGRSEFIEQNNLIGPNANWANNLYIRWVRELSDSK